MVALGWFCGLFFFGSAARAHEPFFLSAEANGPVSPPDGATDFAKSWALYQDPESSAVSFEFNAVGSEHADTRGLLYAELLFPNGRGATCADVQMSVHRGASGASVAVASSLEPCNQCGAPQRRRVALPTHCCGAVRGGEIMYEPYGMTELRRCSFARGDEYERLDLVSPLRIALVATASAPRGRLPAYALSVGCREDMDFLPLSLRMGYLLEWLFLWSTGNWPLASVLLVSSFFYAVLRRVTVARLENTDVKWSGLVGRHNGAGDGAGAVAGDGIAERCRNNPAALIVIVVLWARAVTAFSVSDCAFSDADRDVGARAAWFVGQYVWIAAALILAALYTGTKRAEFENAHRAHRFYIVAVIAANFALALLNSSLTMYVGALAVLYVARP